MTGLQGYFNLLVNFANGVIMPGLVALAFLYAIWNVFRLYIAQGGEEVKGRKNAILYGVATLVALLSFWGAVNWLSRGLGLENTSPITPDYIKQR